MNDNTNQGEDLNAALAQVAQLLRTDPRAAAIQADAILSRSPGHASATLYAGIARRLSGDLSGAIGVLKPLAESQPDWAPVHYELGRVCGAAGRGDEAIDALQRAVELQPLMTGAWHSLSEALRSAGRSDEADAVVTRRLEAGGQDPRLQQAVAAIQAGRYEEANGVLRQHLQVDPTDVLATQMLAAVGMHFEEYIDAGNLLKFCVDLAPNYASAHHDYALVLDKQMRRADALQEIERALEIDPGNADYKRVYAIFLDRAGEFDRAIDIFSDLLQSNPERADLWTSRGHALRAAGREEESIAAYRKTLEQIPHNGEAWWSLADLKTYRFSEEDADSLQGHLQNSDLNVEDRLHIEFTLGKILEDKEDYRGAFEHYAEGNRLRREGSPYDSGQLTAGVARTRAVFSAEFLEQRAGRGSDASDPVFIVGLPRSGSTLLEQILASHSEVEGTMELPDMLAIVRELDDRGSRAGGQGYPEVLADLPIDELRALGDRYIETTRVYRKTDRPVFIDKMPNNFSNVGLIHLLLPNARIVDVRRHPLATCFSIYKQLFALGQPFAYRLDDLGNTYRDYVDLLAHFDEVLPGRIHRVIYEDLIDDTEGEIRRLLDYCGLPFEEACLRFYETDRAVRTASSAQVRQPINRKGLDQWRHFEPWLEPLKMALGPALDEYPNVPDTGSR